MSESLLQSTIIATFRSLYSPYKAISSLNGIDLSKIPQKSRFMLIKALKASGMTPGEADVSVLLDKGVTLHIELKTKSGVQSSVQKDYQKSIESLGHSYYLANSFEVFFHIVNTHLSIEARTALFDANKNRTDLSVDDVKSMLKSLYEL